MRDSSGSRRRSRILHESGIQSRPNEYGQTLAHRTAELALSDVLTGTTSKYRAVTGVPLQNSHFIDDLLNTCLSHFYAGR